MRRVRNRENKVYHIFQYIVYRMNQIEIYVHGISVSQLSG